MSQTITAQSIAPEVIPKQIVGEFTLPLIDENSKNSDPWSRGYGQPPTPGSLVTRLANVTDIRPSIAEPGYTVTGFLKNHGFAVAKQKSGTVEKCRTSGGVDEKLIIELYQPEIEQLVKETLGAKHVVVSATVYRKGKKAPEKWEMPAGLVPVAARANRSIEEEDAKTIVERDQEESNKWQTPGSMSVTDPTRVPHLDTTPRGIRTTSRQAFKKNPNLPIGPAIAAEDEICAKHSVNPIDIESNSIIAENYNKGGKLGPRYASYSIWRPLEKVERDPITLSPRRETPGCADDSLVYWPYENKIPGFQGPETDFLKEYVQMGTRVDGGPKSSLDWYYLSGQKPDEVMFIQLFDSASLGKDSEHMGAPWHGSPEIGFAEGKEPRESMDTRVTVYW